MLFVLAAIAIVCILLTKAKLIAFEMQQQPTLILTHSPSQYLSHLFNLMFLCVTNMQVTNIEF